MNKIQAATAVFMLAAISVTAGYFTAPRDYQVPVTITAVEVTSDAVTVETEETVLEGTTVEYETVTNETDELMPGETETVQQGEDGFAVLTKKVVRENGEVTDETVVEEQTLTEPVPEIVLQGTPHLAAPLEELRLTSGFGQRWGRNHDGVDLGMAQGAPVYAARSGTVTHSGYAGGYGNLIIIDHGSGLETYYAHCSTLLAVEGQQVQTGEIIAEVGSTGNSTGPHLHFETRINGQPQDPLQWLPL